MWCTFSTLLVVMLAGDATAQASKIKPLPLAQLAEKSEVIVLGVVSDVTESDANSDIVSVGVIHVLKGGTDAASFRLRLRNKGVKDFAYNAAIRAWHAGKQEGEPQSDKAATEHTAWLAESLREMQSIQPGMTRADLLKVFQEEKGGLSTRIQRRYAYRGSPFIKVDVRFEAIGAPEDKLTESPQDKITKISKPFLEGPIID